MLTVDPLGKIHIVTAIVKDEVELFSCMQITIGYFF